MRLPGLFIGGFLLIGLLIGGGMLLVRACLSRYDEKAAIAPALYIEKDAQAVLFSIVRYGKTLSYWQRGSLTEKSVSTWYYVQSNDARTGALLNSKKIRHHNDIRYFPVRTLGASGPYAWVYMGELMAFDPLTLDVMADKELLEKNNPALKGKFPAEERFYTFNPSDHHIYFTATDGTRWQLNTTTLKVAARKKDPPKHFVDSLLLQTEMRQKAIEATMDSLRTMHPASYTGRLSGVRDSLRKELFALRNKESAYRRLQTTVQSLQRSGRSFSSIKSNQDTCDGRWYGLYSDEEMTGLHDRVQLQSAHGETARRRLFTAAYDRTGQDRYRISLEEASQRTPELYFLQGGFLLDKQNGLPVRAQSANAWLVVHKDRIGSEGKIMLSCVGSDGRVKWTVNTELTQWTDWIIREKYIYVFGATGHTVSDGFNLFYCIDLASGVTNQYLFSK